MANDVEFVELFCGIGGFAESIRDIARVNIAVDINQNALDVYQLNFDHPVLCKTIESLDVDDAASWANRSWWMSPPCQPHSRRGNQTDLSDPRSHGFSNVLRLIDVLRPPEIAIENVAEFQNSQSHLCLLEVLERCGYSYQQVALCPTQFGYRNRRSRFYMIAAFKCLDPWREIVRRTHELNWNHNENDFEQLALNQANASAYATAISVVKDGDPRRISACFTSAYGRSIVRSGSYLKTESGLRRFSPQEILDQLGFSPDFRLPDWPYSKLWPLVGNSLSIPVVRYVVSHLPSVSSRYVCQDSELE